MDAQGGSLIQWNPATNQLPMTLTQPTKPMPVPA